MFCLVQRFFQHFGVFFQKIMFCLVLGFFQYSWGFLEDYALFSFRILLVFLDFFRRLCFAQFQDSFSILGGFQKIMFCLVLGFFQYFGGVFRRLCFIYLFSACCATSRYQVYPVFIHSRSENNNNNILHAIITHSYPPQA